MLQGASWNKKRKLIRAKFTQKTGKQTAIYLFLFQEGLRGKRQKNARRFRARRREFRLISARAGLCQ
jgi:hypothetical protein